VTIDPFAPTGRPDYQRDRYGRPLVVPADGGKPKPYTRASSIAKTIEDTYNLERWANRNVAYGMAADPSLVARLVALGGTPHEWDQQTKNKVNEIADDAQQAAKAHRGADIGTAVHAMVEQINLGQQVDGGPYRADLDAYRAKVAEMGWTIWPKYVECRLVCDELGAAGTCDMLVTNGGRYYVADLKTGPTISYAVLGYAAQLATYARSDLYDVDTGTRTTVDIHPDVGYLVHLPAGQGRCDVYAIDLDAGYKAARLANTVRRARAAAKSWATLVETVEVAA
jgi:hypothetical protein